MIPVGLLALLAAATIFVFVLILLPGTRDVSTQLRDVAPTKKTQIAPDHAVATRERHGLQANLARAGWQIKPQAMRRRSLTSAGATFGILILLFAIVRHLNVSAFEIAAFFSAVAAYVPFMQLNSAVKKRKAAIVRAFPDFLDMLASTVQAGLAINAAFQTAAPTLHGPLGDELRTALSEMRLGRSRADALRGMAERIDNPDVTNAMRSIGQPCEASKLCSPHSWTLSRSS